MAADKTELRGLVSNDLAQALDALAMANDQDRHAYIVQILEAHVKKRIHEASLIVRVLRGNPLMTDTQGGKPE